MSEVTNVNSYHRPEALAPNSRQASPELTRQTAAEGGKTLPPSSSLSRSPINERKPQESSAQEGNLSDAVTQMNDYLQVEQRDLRFSIDEELGETIVKVLDRETDEVIRQIPNEVFLKLARSLQADEPVHFFSEQA